MIIFVSGDQHWAELMAKEMPSSLDFGPAQTMYEVTASGKFELYKYKQSSKQKYRGKSKNHVKLL